MRATNAQWLKSSYSKKCAPLVRMARPTVPAAKKHVPGVSTARRDSRRHRERTANTRPAAQISHTASLRRLIIPASVTVVAMDTIVSGSAPSTGSFRRRMVRRDSP